VLLRFVKISIIYSGNPWHEGVFVSAVSGGHGAVTAVARAPVTAVYTATRLYKYGTAFVMGGAGGFVADAIQN